MCLQWRLTLSLLPRPCVCVILNEIFKISLIYQPFLSVPFGDLFAGTDNDKATLMVTSNSGRIEVEIPPPTKEDKVRDSHHEPSQGVFQHSQNWLVILAVVSVVALATILAIKQWRQQKKTKGKWFGRLAAKGFIYVRLFGEHGMGYVTFDVRMNTWVQWIKRHLIVSIV